MRAAWSERRTCGRVGSGRLFLCAAAQAGLFLTQEHERGGDQGNVVVEALPASSLEVVQAQFVLEFTVVLFHPPACFRGRHQLGQGDPLPGQARQPVARRRGFTFWPLNERDFLDAFGLRPLFPAVRRP